MSPSLAVAAATGLYEHRSVRRCSDDFGACVKRVFRIVVLVLCDKKPLRVDALPFLVLLAVVASSACASVRDLTRLSGSNCPLLPNCDDLIGIYDHHIRSR